MNRLSSEHWSNYWDKGTVTTFYKKFNNNYDKEIKSHWEKAFSQLPNPAHVVDLATGNGALLSLLNQYAGVNNMPFSAIGIDFAELNPKVTEKVINENVSMVENTLIEDTQLDGSCIDLAISQFGFEYADIPAAVTELDRILKPKASINFIMHAHNSQIINDGHNSLKQIELVNNQLKINKIIRKIVPAIHKLRETGQQRFKLRADHLRDQLNESIAIISKFAESIADPGYIDFYYEHALSLFKGQISQTYTVEQKMQQLDWVESETASLKLRMQDLTSVAMTEQANKNLTDLLEQVGFKDVEIQPFEYNNAIIGQTLLASRG